MRVSIRTIMFLLLIHSSLLLSNVLHVPSQYPTIQSAIDASNTGDTILVQPGTYVENIVINNIGEVILISEQGAAETIIDGNHQSTVLQVENSSYISGFTIINGRGTTGGVIVGQGNSILKNLIVENNEGTGMGGGISIGGSDSPLLENIKIANNRIVGDGYGGGLSIGRGSPIIKNMIIKSNTDSSGKGGGIYVSQYYPNVTNVYLKNVQVFNNYAKYGGGIYFESGQVTFDSTYIINNSAIIGGGIDANSEGILEIQNSFICNNNADAAGGVRGYGNTTILNTSICFNNAEEGSVGIGSCQFQSSTFANNAYYPSDHPGVLIGPPDLTVNQSNFLNNKYAVRIQSTGSAANGENNWWGDPSGPYHPSQNPQGQGDSVNLYVDITPFLVSPNLDAPPMPVQNLHIDSISQTSVSFSWEPSPLSDIAGYRVGYDTTDKNILYSNIIEIENVTHYEFQDLQPDIKYYISVNCYDIDGNISWFCEPIIVLNGNPINVEVEFQKPEAFRLSQNFPNPFNPVTKISYVLPKPGFVTIKIYNILGREIATLINEEKLAGNYIVEFNGSKLVSGVYFYRIKAGDFIQTKKMILLK